MENIPFEGRVVTVKGSTIYVNVGERNGIKAGTSFVVYRPGESIVDEDTGEVLGSEEERIGTLKVTQVKEKYSAVTKTTGGNIQKGDLVRED